MPEGHTIHRLAAEHRRHLVGRRVSASSPQGRFAREAALLDGRRLLGSEAYGKHLFLHWEDAPSLHVHLGLIGRFALYRDRPPPSPTEQTRLVLRTDGVAAHLSGPMVCRLIDPGDVDSITAPLGPDPLGAPRRSGEFVARLRRRRLPVGAALLDQRIVAGVGNVYRAEILFLCGIHPLRAARDVTESEAEGLWAVTVSQMRHGARLGRIITVDPREVGRRRRSVLPDGHRLYVYGRAGEPCRRCGTPIAAGRAGGRTVWWCPGCQAG